MINSFETTFPGTILALFTADSCEFWSDLREASLNFKPIELSQLTTTRDLMEKLTPVSASPSVAFREIIELTPTIWPWLSIKGPPELPRLKLVSV